MINIIEKGNNIYTIEIVVNGITNQYSCKGSKALKRLSGELVDELTFDDLLPKLANELTFKVKEITN